MSERTLIASATNLLWRGFQVVPTDRKSRAGEPVNGLYAVARALTRVLAFKEPARAVAIIDTRETRWPDLLKKQLPALPELLRAFGLQVIETTDELHLVASYAKAALAAGDDVIIAGVDKRYAQLVGEKTWWFDANKDVRYTTEIVQKRFNVPPAQVAQWLALVGDDDELPGVAGIGAKGASELLEKYGTVEKALEELDALKGRVGNALRAAKDQLPAVLAQGKLDTTRPLPRPLESLRYTAPDLTALNALFDKLGFAELLTSAGAARAVEVCEQPGEVTAALERLGKGPVAVHALLEDPNPSAEALTGLGLSAGAGVAFYVPTAAAGWKTLVKWLEDPKAPKQGHSLVSTTVALRRMGLQLAGIVADSECQSHLTEPSNWAPHELAIVARHVLGRALPDDDEVRGVGRARKAWSELTPERAAEVAGQRADASAAISARLGPPSGVEGSGIEGRTSGVDRAQLDEYLELSQTLVRMELTGICVDPAELDRAEAAFVGTEAELEKEITALAGHEFNINSSKQLGKVLFEELKLPVVLHTPTGWSVANEALERIDHAHPIVGLVIRWRGVRRLRDSWINSLRKCIDSDGRVHSRFHLARSFTGHLINTNPDLGRVPGRTPEMARIRRAFVAPPGKLLMSVDFNQLGLHVLAHLTKDPALIEPLRRSDDMHRLTAAAVLEKPPEAITLEERQVGKVVNFATFAGQGASSLGMQLGITPPEAKEYIARFDRRYAGVRAFQDEQLRLVRERGYITTIAGRRWPIGGLESLDSQLRSAAERLSRRATHEASVSDISRRALLLVDRALRSEGLKTVPLLQILDEVLFEVPEAELERAAKLCAKTMREAWVLEVPLKVGVEVGKNWADLQPLPPSP
ncbi:MAG: DNA polymerase [Archangium sp.]|nr:DNA polymerase [Archangium sp.]